MKSSHTCMIQSGSANGLEYHIPIIMGYKFTKCCIIQCNFGSQTRLLEGIPR